jgi:hypothetical protein
MRSHARGLAQKERRASPQEEAYGHFGALPLHAPLAWQTLISWVSKQLRSPGGQT